MRAAVLTRPGEPLTTCELPDPVPGPGQVLLRVRCRGGWKCVHGASFRLDVQPLG